MSLAERLSEVQALLFGAEPSESALARVGDPERLRLYRSMVRTRIADVVNAALPRTSRLAHEAAIREAFDAYLAGGGPRTRYFWRIPLEYAEVLRARLDDAALADLLEYERTRWRLRHDEADRPGPCGSLSFDLPPLVNPAHALLRLDHKVDVRGEEARREERRLAVFRSPADHRVEVLVLNPTSHALLEAMAEPGARSLTEIVQGVARTRGVEVTPRFIERLSHLLELALDKGLLLGSRR